VAVAIAAVGEAGHQILGGLGATLAHHLFHIAFGLGAFVAFAAYVAVDIHRHGRPTFSWRLRSAERGKHAHRPAA
jgi:hypothetical protein